MSISVDGILLIGFGGPTAPEEIRPFLANVTRGKNIPEPRLQKVIQQYQTIGGRSPYNDHTFKQAEALKALAAEKGFKLPVYLGMRNWNPYLKDTLIQMKKDGVKRALGFILAPHQCFSSFDQYLADVQNAKTEAAFPELRMGYVDSWHEHPLYIAAVADRVRETLDETAGASTENSLFIFTAHSIPETMASNSRYAGDVEDTAKLVAEMLGIKRWITAYQSRSGRPEDPWLAPDISEVLTHGREHGIKRVVVVPAGFLSDHAEVLYDLDHEAKRVAESRGIEFFRVSTVMDHPKFIQMMLDVITTTLGVEISQ